MDPHQRIVVGVEIGRPFEGADGDGVSLQAIGATGESLVYDEGQKGAEIGGIAERIRRQDAFEGGLDFSGLECF